MIVTCRDLAQRWTELEEGAQSAVERASLRFHLSICARCRRYVSELASLKTVLADIGSAPLASEAPDEGSVSRAIASFRAWTTAGAHPDDD